VRKKKKGRRTQAPVAHACNPSYSGGRDQRDCSLKPAQAHSSQDPILKKPITKKGLAMRGVREGAGGRGEKWPKQCMHIWIK
jgi:hypothetical protein